MTRLIYTRTASPFSLREAPVTLARAPWDAPTATPDPRPETAPPRGIKGQPRLTQAEISIAAIREVYEQARAEA